MKKPMFLFEFIKGEEDWDYGLITMDLMFSFFLLPEKAKDYDNGVKLWEEYDLQNLVKGFFSDKASFNPKQSNLFLDGTDAISRMLLTGCDETKSKIFEMVLNKTTRFKTIMDFERFYLHHASNLLQQIKNACSKEPELLQFYNNLFQRGKDNFKYKEWRESLNLIYRP